MYMYMYVETYVTCSCVGIHVDLHADVHGRACGCHCSVEFPLASTGFCCVRHVGCALFSLAALKGKGSLADLADVSAPAEHELEDYEADSDENVAQPGENDSDAEDSDEEERYAVSLCTSCLLHA